MIRNLAANRQLDRVHAQCCCVLRQYATFPRRASHATPEAVDAPRLPRYLRRQSAAPKPTTAQPQGQDDGPSSLKREFRSRKFDPSKEQPSKTDIRLLEPHVLSARLKKLCDANKVDDAVAMLKNSPRDAQNTQVWNTLIWECMKVKRFNLSYQLYTDMKRRGFNPTARTFQTMFTGLSKIDNWASHTKQLDNAHSIYDAFQRYMASVKKHDPESAELTPGPLTNYVKILGDNELYQEVFDVYYALPSEGPLAPNVHLYTAMFQALASTPNARPTELHHQNADNAKVLWTQMQKALKKAPTSFAVDTYLATAAIAALSRGRTPEHELAFTITRSYFGLRAPGDPPSKGTLPLTQPALDAILKLCNSSRNFSLCVDFFQQVKRRPSAEGGIEILDHGHLNEVLRSRVAAPDAGAAYACLEMLEWMLRQEIVGRNGYRIRPTIASYNLVMTACWRDGDWRSAARVFDLMTGYHSHDFMDGAVSSAPRRDARGPGRSVDLGPETLSSLVRTALTSRDSASVRQCLRIVDFLGVDKMFASDRAEATKTKTFFTGKLAAAIVEALQFVAGASTKGTSPPEIARWRRLAGVAAQYEKRRAAQKSDFIPTMVLEGAAPEQKAQLARDGNRRSSYSRQVPIAPAY
ncbi:hypothetical protein DXG03_002860 [Asterophora parasitica]|uniref:Pentatricopeptide repeat protein n=1 Tax=Asterophora parasitica TaxID=117018 RepID=A0A9P7GGG3_9AGAR|nr:hypothetical protein DXG03_002860 [Asterophora parasitica]